MVFWGQGSHVRSLRMGEPQATADPSERQDGFSIIFESEPYMPEACLGKNARVDQDVLPCSAHLENVDFLSFELTMGMANP